ncbi:MAG: C40 family peptidase [Rhodocyclaceae bacterium]|nr:C40 family peptidase [Rhodocyclaceae bacterium]
MRRAAALLLVWLVAGCATRPPEPARPEPGAAVPAPSYIAAASQDALTEAALYALALVDRHYRYGGRNPDSGLDCSGMVSHIYENVAGLRLPHNAAQIAAATRPVERAALQPGDLVFFNTQGRAYSHVGLYLGENRFVHAPSSSGKYVKVESLDKPYFASRYNGARTLAPAFERPYAAVPGAPRR